METKFAHLFLDEKTRVFFSHNYEDFPHIVLSNVAETGEMYLDAIFAQAAEKEKSSRLSDRWKKDFFLGKNNSSTVQRSK